MISAIIAAATSVFVNFGLLSDGKALGWLLTAGAFLALFCILLVLVGKLEPLPSRRRK